METTSFSKLLKLSVAERIQLAQDLWDSVAAEPERVPLSEDHRRELDRRLADLEHNPDSSSTWEEVRARLLGQI